MRTRCDCCKKSVGKVGGLEKRAIKNKTWFLCAGCRNRWSFEIKVCPECGAKYPVLKTEECPVCGEIAKIRGSLNE